MGKVSLAFALLLSLSIGGAGAVFAGDDEPPVKKSKAGLCHERGSPYYEQTKRFTSYDSMRECVASGGRGPDVRRTFSQRVWDLIGLDRWFDAPYRLKRTWLWIVAGFLALAGLLIYWLIRRRRSPGPFGSHPWKGSGAQEDLEFRRWEGHRIGRKK